MIIELRLLKTKKQYQQLLTWIDEQFSKGVKPDTSSGDRLEIALLLIKKYEDEVFPIPFPDPIEAIKQKMEEKGLRNKDFVGLIGSKSYVSALLNKRKPLTLEIAKFFHKKLGIPASVLLA